MSFKAFLHTNWLNAVTAVLFAVAFWRIGLSPELPAVLAFVFGGVLLAVIDWRVQRLPRRIVFSTLGAVAGGLVFAAAVSRDWQALVTAVMGALLFSSAFFVIWLVTTRLTGMVMLGFGDVRLAVVLGMLLGWYGLPFVLYGAIVGHLFALAIAVAMSLRDRRVHVRYSFGPPLIAGTLAVVLIAG
jgi:leader peptidase (prepilin peptidase)/N-methyltransferase